MKMILSRKGFDSGSGGCASPVLPDGIMLSLPIPETGITVENITPVPAYMNRFTELIVNCLGINYTYRDILDSLSPKLAKNQKAHADFCHVDPDLREDIRSVKIDRWVPGFGQCGTAQTHLQNRGVSIGDLFIFFGWFKNTTLSPSNQIIYRDHDDGFQAIYGYMQVGSILKGEDIALHLPWHPHASPQYKDTVKNNTVYIPSEELIIDNECFGPGYGTFPFNERLILSKEGRKRSEWKLLDWMENTNISYHSANSVHEDYFQSAKRGQEFIFDANKQSINWFRSLLLSEQENAG